MSGQLYLLPCPISEAPALDALPASTVETARRIDHFLVEVARTARATLKAMGHPKPIAELDIVEIGHDPAPELISEWLQPVLDGADAAVLSESGCPGVADPCAQIAARAHELGIRVVPLTGPSSILLTLMASGLDGQRFRFSGYLPKHDAERRAAILAAEKASRASETQLFIETPYRNTALLDALLETLAPDTRLTVAIDVTGQNESIRTLTAAAWKAIPKAMRTLPKLPTVFAFLAKPGKTAPRYAPECAGGKRAHPAPSSKPAVLNNRPKQANKTHRPEGSPVMTLKGGR